MNSPSKIQSFLKPRPAPAAKEPPAKQTLQEFHAAGGGVPTQYKGREHVWHAMVDKFAAGGAVQPAALIDGNDFVKAAQANGLKTDNATLNKIVARVNKGESVQEAAKNVAQSRAAGGEVHMDGGGAAFYPRVGNIKSKNFKPVKPPPLIEDPRAMNLPQYGDVDLSVPTKENLELGSRMAQRDADLKRQREGDRSLPEKIAGVAQAGRFIGSALTQAVNSLPTRMAYGDEAADKFMQERLYKPEQPTAYEYVDDVGNFLERLETEAKIPPVLPEATALQYLAGPAASQAKKAAGQGALSLAKSDAAYNLAQKALASPALAAVRPMNVVKPTGGNFLTGRTEKDLQSLKAKGPTEVDREWLINHAKQNPEAAQTGLEAIPKNEALNNWVDSNLTNYVQKQMGTAEDPARLMFDKRAQEIDAQYAKDIAKSDRIAQRAADELDPRKQANLMRDAERIKAEANMERQTAVNFITHKPGLVDDYLHEPESGPQVRRAENVQEQRKKAGFPEEGLGQSPAAKAWETSSDEVMQYYRAGDIQDAPAKQQELDNLEQKLASAKDALDEKVRQHLSTIDITEQERENLVKGLDVDEKAAMVGDVDFMNAKAQYHALRHPMTERYLDIAAENPYIAKLDPNTRLYSAYTRELGFDHIMDVLREDLTTGRIRPDQMNKISITDAMRRTSEYDRDLADKMNASRAAAREGLPTYREYPEGYKWIELNKPGAFSQESEAMGHSVRGYEPPKGHPDWTEGSGNAGSPSYGLGGWEAIKSGKAKVYSLVDSKGAPHATVEVGENKDLNPFFEWWNQQTPEKRAEINQRAQQGEHNNSVFAAPEWLAARPALLPRITQIRGKSNRAPNEEYLPYIQDFVKGGQWSDVNDLRHTGLIRKSDLIDKFSPDELDAIGAGEYLTKAEQDDLLLRALRPPEEGMAGGGVVRMGLGGPAKIAKAAAAKAGKKVLGAADEVPMGVEPIVVKPKPEPENYSQKVLDSTAARLAEKIAAANPKMKAEEVAKKAMNQATKKLDWERTQKPALKKRYGALVNSSYAESNPAKKQNTPAVVEERMRKANEFLDIPTEAWNPPRSELQAFDRSSIKDALEGFPGVEQSKFPRDIPSRANIEHVEGLYTDPANRALIEKQIKRGLPLGGESFYASLYPVKQAVLEAGMPAEKFDQWIHSLAPASARNSIMNEMAVGQFLRNMNARGIPLTEENVAREMEIYAEKFGVGLPLMPVHRQGVANVVEGGQNLRDMSLANIPTNYKIPTYGSQKAGDFANSVVLDVHEAGGQTQGSRYHPYFNEQGGFGNTEYNAGEQGMLGIANELGIPGGMAQAGRWFGGGELTGLKSPRGDALDLLEKQVAYTLQQKGVQPNPANVRAEVLRQIETGEGDLLPWYRKEGMPDVRQTGLQRAEGGEVHMAEGGLIREKRFDGGGMAATEFAGLEDSGGSLDKAKLMTKILAEEAKKQGSKEAGSLSKPRALTDLLNRGVLANNPLSAGVDLFNMGLSAVGMGSDKPFLGSEYVKDLMNKYNVTSGEERPMMETALSFASPAGMIKGAMKAPGAVTKVKEALTPSKIAPLATEAKTAQAGKPTGVAYATKQEGPFYRVTPTNLDTSAAKTRGIKEADGLPSSAPLGGGAEQSGREVPKFLSSEEVGRIIADPVANEPLNIAKKYTQDTQGVDFGVPQVPSSSLAKQSGIARTFDLAVQGSPEYKSAIFGAYGREMPDLMEKIGAKNYDDLMEKAYRQMAKETDEQFRRLPFNFSYHRAGEGNYNGAKDMASDVHGNKHLYVYQGGDKHDFLHNVDPQSGLNENEKFRAVHDLLGHAIYGNEFGPKGEEMAWAVHQQMYSPLARMAMTAETRGQNSVVNYSPLNAKLKQTIAEYERLGNEALRRGDKKFAKEIAELKKQAYFGFEFAPNKAVLLPPEFMNPQFSGGMPNYLAAANRPTPGTSIKSPLTHFSNEPGLTFIDPRKYGTGIKGAEADRLMNYPGAVRDRSYFYMGEPGTVLPEPGLGLNRYRGEASSLYDITQDPLDFRVLAREANRTPYTSRANQGVTYPLQEANDMERLVSEYGYQGMANPKATKPTAIMFGQTPVQRQKRGGLSSIK